MVSSKFTTACWVILSPPCSYSNGIKRQLNTHLSSELATPLATADVWEGRTLDHVTSSQPMTPRHLLFKMEGACLLGIVGAYLKTTLSTGGRKKKSKDLPCINL